jgi:hypothetical protein
MERPANQDSKLAQAADCIVLGVVEEDRIESAVLPKDLCEQSAQEVATRCQYEQGPSGAKRLLWFELTPNSKAQYQFEAGHQKKEECSRIAKKRVDP